MKKLYISQVQFCNLGSPLSNKLDAGDLVGKCHGEGCLRGCLSCTYANSKTLDQHPIRIESVVTSLPLVSGNYLLFSDLFFFKRRRAFFDKPFTCFGKLQLSFSMPY